MSRFFAGHHEQKVDGKRRTSVPAHFREVIGKENMFFAFPALHNGRSVECRTEAQMAALSDELNKLPDMSEARISLELATFGRAHPLKPDKNGRIVLPEELTKHAKISDSVIFVGTGTHFFLYNPDSFSDRAEEARVKAQVYRSSMNQDSHQSVPAPSGAPAGGA